MRVTRRNSWSGGLSNRTFHSANELGFIVDGGINKIDDRFQTSISLGKRLEGSHLLYTTIKKFRIDPIWAEGIKLSLTSRASDPRRTSRVKILLNERCECNDLCNGGRFTF